MTNILILPEEGDNYRALAGDKESTGRTPGQALDALRSQLTEEETSTLVIVQSHKPDHFFDAAQQERLAELMRLRDAGKLTAEDERELESLIEAELRGAMQRVKGLPGAVRRNVLPPSPAPPEDSYIVRIAQESLTYEQEVRRQIMAQARNDDLAKDVVTIAIPRVIKYAVRYGPAKELGDVKMLLSVISRNLLIDAQTKRPKAEKSETANQSGAAESGLPNLPHLPTTNEIKQDPPDTYLERIARECMAHKAKIEGRISSITNNPTLAEDLTAQAMMRVVAYAAQHHDEGRIENVEAYLNKTASNLLNDYLSKKLKADRLETMSWNDAAESGLLDRADESPTGEIERRIAAAELKELVLRDTTPAQKELFEMWFERDMTPGEISVLFGISSATVRVRLHTLVAKMRDAVTKLYLP